MKKFLNRLCRKNFLFLLVAGCINAVGVTVFLAPVKLYDSGLTIRNGGAIDFVVEGIDRSKSVMIVTEKAEELNAALPEEFKSGTTKIAGTGGYSNAEKTIIYFVVNRFQIYKMKEIIRSIDPTAFVTISEVADVLKGEKK